MENANKPPAKTSAPAANSSGTSKWAKAPVNPSLFDKLLPPGTARRKFAIPVVAGVIVLAVLAKVAVTTVSEKVETSRRAEAEAVRVQTTGVLLVKSNLPQADVEIVRVAAEGETAPSIKGPLGQALANLAPGKYAVTLRAADWPDAHGEIDVPAGQRTETTINFPAGSLRLESAPSGATVKRAGAVLGKTPLVIPLLPPGEVELSVAYAGWPPLPFKASIAENTESSAAVRIPHGRLTVDSFPAGAVVVLDGKSYKQTPLFFDPIAAGPRKLTLQAKDLPPLEVAVTVVDGRETRIRPVLANGYPLLEPAALLRDVWVVDDKRNGAPAFNSITSQNRPRNDIVRNLHRQVLYDSWLRKIYRVSGKVLTFDASTGALEFEGQRSELAPYRIVARMKAGAGAAPPAKGTALSLYGRLTDVLESAWPLRVVTFEFADAEILPEDEAHGAK